MRRFCKGEISKQENPDYSEWFQGNSKLPYYTLKKSERREIYAAKCMKNLTFLDYSTLETTDINIETKLYEKEFVDIALRASIYLIRQKKNR